MTEREDAARPLPPAAAAAVVFLSAAAVLVVEIVGLRLIAPYVGITLQTNSSVIGAALCAIAFGAWAGGRVADRTDPSRLLGPVLLVGGALTMLTLPIVRTVGTATEGEADTTAVLLLAMLAVFAPAALLSTVTPMVVKLQLHDLGQTGSVVGKLSGIGTLGGIVATFVTGFVLVAALPTSAILLGTGGVLVLAGLAVVYQHRTLRDSPVPKGALALVPLAPLLVVVAPNPCEVETAYHCASVEADTARPDGRVLRLDTLRHSYVDLGDPEYLEFAYTKAMSTVVDAMRPAGAPIRALHVGGGGFTMPRYVAATRPGSGGTALEIDGGVVELDRRKLGLNDVPDLRVRVGDGRTGLATEPDGRYDLVIGDAFGGLAVPWHLTTREATEQIARTLTADGVYAVNVIDYQPDRFARAEVATLRAVFGTVAILADAGTTDGAGGGNHVLVASKRPLPLADVATLLRDRVPGWVVSDPAATATFAGDAAVLTDDHAPVDQLITTHPRR